MSEYTVIDFVYEGQADARLAHIASELHDLRGSVDELERTLASIARSLSTIAEVASNR